MRISRAKCRKKKFRSKVARRNWKVKVTRRGQTTKTNTKTKISKNQIRSLAVVLAEGTRRESTAFNFGF